MDTQRSAEDLTHTMAPYADNTNSQAYGRPLSMTSVMSDAANNLLIDLPLLLAIFRRRIGLFAGGLLTILALVTLITFQLTPKYVAEATVLIDTRKKQSVDISAIYSGVTADSATVDTEVELISSRVIAERVTEKMSLYDDPEFNPTLREPTGLRGFIKGLFPSQVTESLDAAAEQRIAREKTVNNVMSNLSVERAGLTYLIAIRFESEDQQKAAAVVNAFAEQYLVRQLDAKFDYIRRSRSHLSDRTDELQEDVRIAEAAVEQYREENGLFESQGSSLTEQQISDINSQLITQRAALAERRARLSSVKGQLDNGSGADSISEVLNSPVIGALRAQQSEMARRKSELAIKYGERHPEILKVNREEEDLLAQIDTEIARIVSSLESEVNIARDRVISLESSLAGKRTELADNNRALVRLRELERQAEASRTIYESFLDAFKESNEQEALTESDAEIVSAAVIPTSPAFPNKILNILLGLVLGAGVGAMLVTLAEIFDNGLRTAEDIERMLSLPLVTAIPTLSPGLLSGTTTPVVPQDYLVDKPLSSFAEAYRTVRSSILLEAGARSKPKVLALTSALSSEGKTTSARCLGRICAMSGDKVIVIDCDARRRTLSDAMPEAKIGLMEVLTGTAQLKDAVRKDSKTNLHVLPIAGAQQDVVDVFGSNAFDSLISKLKTKYDLIILDTAPVTAVADTRTIINSADSTLLIVRWRSTSSKIARSAATILSKLPTPVHGAVLTQVDAKSQTQYGYEGSAAYYSSYKKYYHD
ncbi:polysaccharide biosynthesis tyrosine autokinase [Parvularcula sp. IMCC14364]|uniref:GumC family protein n=1 Tax=Parvularcula sp. IMCC14364 TaxID=3067902 RepID=UPI0027428D67|nr:polysaccharide biosynthesis tyrosine autokinase [Parvularcula sp. IMCC14364]